MPTTVQRLCKNKDVDMLIAAATIIETAISNKAFLQPISRGFAICAHNQN